MITNKDDFIFSDFSVLCRVHHVTSCSCEMWIKYGQLVFFSCLMTHIVYIHNIFYFTIAKLAIKHSVKSGCQFYVVGTCIHTNHLVWCSPLTINCTQTKLDSRKHLVEKLPYTDSLSQTAWRKTYSVESTSSPFGIMSFHPTEQAIF